MNKRKQSENVVTSVTQVWIPKYLISMLNDLKGQERPKHVWFQNLLFDCPCKNVLQSYTTYGILIVAAQDI